MAGQARTRPAPRSCEVLGPAPSNDSSHPGIRLVIASPVRLLREGLAASLQDCDGIDVIDVISLDSPGIARIIAAVPDFVLVDVGKTDIGAAALLLKNAVPATKLIAFALDEIDVDVFACAAAGFSGYVPRESGAKELQRALKDAVAGRMRCAPHIAAAMFGRLAALLRVADPRAALPLLTSRESEVLALAEEGCSNKEIARRLTISCATVKNHVHSILQKLQVTRRGQAVARLRASAEAEWRSRDRRDPKSA